MRCRPCIPEPLVNPAVNTEAGAVQELHDSLLAELRATGRLGAEIRRTIPLIEKGKVLTVSDAPTRAIVLDARGEHYAVLFVSNSFDVSYVARAVANAAAAKRVLGEDLGSVILDPIAHGEFRGFSYVLWPWHRPVTQVRGLAYLQRRLLQPRVLGWLRDATARTARRPSGAEVESTFAGPLGHLAQDERLPAWSRDLARRGLERLAAGTWRPSVVLEHKDFGHWNILRPRDRAHQRQFPRGFILIDWSGANLAGYPFANLLSRARTSRVSTSVLTAELRRHCQILSCESDDIMPCVLAGLGFVGGNLGHFAEADYIAQSLDIMRFSMKAAGLFT